MSLDERSIWEDLWTGYLDFYDTKRLNLLLGRALGNLAVACCRWVSLPSIIGCADVATRGGAAQELVKAAR